MLEMYNDYTKYTDDYIFGSCWSGFKNIEFMAKTKPTMASRNKRLE